MRLRLVALAVAVALGAAACSTTGGNPSTGTDAAPSTSGDPKIAAGPAALEFSENVAEILGGDGLDAVLLALAQGYNGDQLLAGGRGGMLSLDGVIVDGDQTVAPANPPPLVVVLDDEEAMGRVREMAVGDGVTGPEMVDVVLTGDVATTTIALRTLREFAIERTETDFARDPDYDYGNASLNRATLAFVGAYFEQGFAAATLLEVLVRGSDGGAFNRLECPFVLIDEAVLYGANRADPDAGCPVGTAAAGASPTADEPTDEPLGAGGETGDSEVTFPYTVSGSIEVDPELLAPGDDLTSEVTLTLLDDGTFTSTWTIELLELSADVLNLTRATIDGEWSAETGRGRGTGTQETTVTDLGTDETETTTADVQIDLELLADGTVAIGEPGDPLYVLLKP